MTFDLLFESDLIGEIPGKLYEGYNVTIFNIGTTFDDITKPIVVPVDEMKDAGFVFIG
ncbi:MAG: hypothetical protein MJ200_02915 [Mycoplasmoidaceae bacterium]|nr:hypothetical protein [Mycoplasmoidaceae bacterium]